MHSTRCALAITNASLPTYFDLKDGLTAPLIFGHRDIAELKTPRLVGAESSVGGEQNIIVQLFRFPRKRLCFGSKARFRVAS
jgi:hypothetical protein